MVCGHSFLPNDRDFSSVETARQRREHIYVPEHWHDLIRTARHNNPFCVCVMDTSDFVSLEELKKSKSEGNYTWSESGMSMRWIQVNKDKPFHFRFRYSHNTLEGWKIVDLNRKTKGRPPVICHLPLPVLHGNGRAINKKKVEDLMSLIQFVPPIYHDFYKGLQADDIQSEAQED